MSLFTDIRTAVDEVGAAAFFTDAHIYDAANEAQTYLYTLLHPYATAVPWVVPTGEEFVGLPSELMVPLYIQDNEHLYFPTTQTALEHSSLDWRTEDWGVPRMFAIWDSLKIRPYPRANANYLYTMTGVAWPEEMSASTLDITAPRLLRDSIAARAASNLLESTQPHLADLLNAQAAELENDARKQLRNLHSHSLRRFHPAPPVERRGNPYFRKSL